MIPDALWRLLVGVGAITAMGAGSAVGQACPTGAVLSGRVLDAGTKSAIEAASVELSGTDACGSSVTLMGATGANGWYRFEGLGLGEHELRVRRLGYRPVMITVELNPGSALQVSLGLEALAIELEPIVGARPAPDRQPFSSLRLAPTQEVTSWRADIARDRQMFYLPTDVRSVTEADLTEAGTLAEPDVLRALHSLPGVSTRDDFSAELWTRGASADQSRVYFDGLPLYSPYHLLGAFSGFNADAVGSVTFLPGVRSARIGEGAASVVDIESRRASGMDFRGTAGLSPVSARASGGRQFQNGRGGWTVAARRTFVDGISSALSGMGVSSVSSVPYAFGDITARTDVALGDGTALEWSGLYQEDRVSGDIPRLAAGNRARWGNAASRLTMRTDVGGMRLRSTVGLSRFDALVDDIGSIDSAAIAAHPQTSNTIDHYKIAAHIEPLAAPGASWSIGLEASERRHRYDGPAADPTGIPRGSALSRTGIVGLQSAIASVLGLDRLVLDEAFRELAVWGERRWNLSPHFSVETGLRVEASDAVLGQPSVRTAPRIMGRYESAGGRLILSGGFGRSFQYTQSLVRTPVLRSGLRASEVWLTAGDSVPAIRADIATVGGEFWLDESLLASLNIYRRDASGVVIPDPVPGPVGERAFFRIAENRAQGIEFSLRKLSGRRTWSVTYAYGTSTLETTERAFAAPEERWHTLNTAVMQQLSGAWRVGGTFVAASGVPFTRAIVSAACNEPDACSANSVLLGEPGAARGPMYANLNLLVDWTHRYETWTLGLYFQLHNVLGRRNDVTYNSSVVTGSGAQRDLFENGLPRLPVLGIRVWF